MNKLCHFCAIALRAAGLAALAVWFTAASQAEELNSERIERLFGSYGVDIVHQSEQRRVSNLHSLGATGPITRTFALVSFAEPVPALLDDAHSQIVSGGSIGATLKENGFEISKITLFIGELDIPPEAQTLASLMRIDVPATLPMHVYRLAVQRASGLADYATIIEIHHPALHSVDSLIDAYGAAPEDAAGAHYRALALTALPR